MVSSQLSQLIKKTCECGKTNVIFRNREARLYRQNLEIVLHKQVCQRRCGWLGSCGTHVFAHLVQSVDCRCVGCQCRGVVVALHIPRQTACEFGLVGLLAWKRHKNRHCCRLCVGCWSCGEKKKEGRKKRVTHSFGEMGKGKKTESRMGIAMLFRVAGCASCTEVIVARCTMVEHSVGSTHRPHAMVTDGNLVCRHNVTNKRRLQRMSSRALFHSFTCTANA